MSRENNIVWKFLLKVQKIILVITGIACMGIVSSAMLLRWLFNTDFKGYEEILVMFAFWLYMIGSSYGSYEKSQITADILDIYMKEGKVKSIINTLRAGLTAGLGLVFTYWSYDFMMWGITMKTKTPVWRLPAAIGYTSVFVGLILVSLYNVVYFYDEIKLCIQSFRKSTKIEA